MNSILNYILESSICLALAILFYKLVLDRLTHYEWNRVTILSFLVASLTIPLLNFDLKVGSPEMSQTLSLPMVTVGENVSAAVTTTATSVNYFPFLLAAVYVLGLLYFLTQLGLGLYRVGLMVRVGERSQYMGFTVITNPNFQPSSFFRFIFLPSFDPSDDNDRQIFLHETVHVRRSHTLDLLTIQLVKVVFWFNPLLYVFETMIREVHEFEADGAVSKVYSKKHYSFLLLNQLAKESGLVISHPFNQFQTKKRIIMMNQPKSNDAQKLRFLFLVPLLGMMFFIFSCNLTPEEELEGPTQMGEKQVAMGPSDLLSRARTLGADGEEIFDVVEDQPNPPGGMAGWNEYLKANLTYPKEAKQMGVEGTVIVVFVVNSDGSISDVEILRGIGAGCDEEAIRVVENAPNWTPGYQRDRVINTRMRMPIRFKLSQESATQQASPGFEEVIEIPINN